MKSPWLKLAQVFLVVVFVIAPLLPVCSAGAACTMPCCSQGAPHPGGSAAPSPGPGCCPVPEPPPRQIGAGCGTGPLDLDLQLVFSGAFLPMAALPPADFLDTPGAPPSRPWDSAGLALAARTPLYLRVQTLRI